MRVLVFGGTGTMGRYLVERLYEDGNEIVITSRDRHNTDRDRIYYEKGNAHDLEFVLTLFEKYDRFDAIVDFMIYSIAEFKERYDILLNNTKQYVFLSSSRVYANSSKPLVEESPRLLDTVDDEEFRKSEKYAIVKAKEEDLLINSNHNNWTIVRPYITYGNNRFQLGVYEKEDWLYRVINGRSIVFSKDIANKKTTMTFAGDVSKGIASLLGKNEAFGRIYHITTEKEILWSEVLSVYSKILDKNGFHVNVILTEFASDVINRSEQVRYDRAYDRVFNNEKIGNFVDVSGYVEPTVGLSDCLEEFLLAPHFKDINWVTQARMDRCTSESTPFNRIVSLKDKFVYFILRYCIDYKKIEALWKLR